MYGINWDIAEQRAMGTIEKVGWIVFELPRLDLLSFVIDYKPG